MKSKVILSSLLVAVAVFSSCVSAPVPVPTNTAVNIDLSFEESNRVNQNWITPAEVKISNYYAGAIAEWSIRIHNGKDVINSFAISYRDPGKTREGYLPAPIEARDWIIIADESLVFAPQETKEILITLAMPKGTVVAAKQWEFWISVMEQRQGNIQTEMASRWLVSMK